MSKSDARATLESSIITGLSEHAHLTGANIEYAHIQVPDILDALFDLSVRWAVREYLEELEGEGNERLGYGCEVGNALSLLVSLIRRRGVV